MFKESSKSMISLTHDQLSDVIQKTTQKCVIQQHHHYYHNDLIYECNIILKNQRQPKRRNGKISKHKTRTTTTTTKYHKSLKRSIKIFESFQYNNYNNSTSRSIINSLSDIAFLSDGERRVNLKILHLFNNYLTDICVCFQEKFITLQLVLVIILSALITCTGQNIDSNLNSQQKQITSQHKFFVAAVNDVNARTNSSLHTILCRHGIPNTLPSPRAGLENNFKFQMNISRHLRYSRYYHWCFKNKRKHIQFNTRNISVKYLLIHANTISVNDLNATKTHQPYKNIYNNDDDYNKSNDSSIIISKMQKTNNTNTNNIKMNNQIAKDKQNYQLDIQKSDINFYFNNLTNKSANANYKTRNSERKIFHKRKQSAAEIVNYNFYDHHVEKYTNSFSHRAVTERRKLNLLTSANRSLQFVNDQEHVDHIKLIKIVLDGLGLKKVPQIEKVNISQVEYVTKYREYLHRIRKQKCQNLKSENKETYLRPLDILTIATKSTLSNQKQDRKRRKRNTFQRVVESNKYDLQQPENEHKRNHSLEERIRNILVLKKKYQKPRSAKKERDVRKSYTLLKFALEAEILNLNSTDIEEANIRLVLIQSSILAIRNSENKKLHHQSTKNSSCGLGKKKIRKQNVLNLKLFHLLPRGKRALLDDRKIDIKVDLNKIEETHTQWLQFDVTKAVKRSIDEKRLNHVALELQCDNCKRNGARILNEAFNTAADEPVHDNSSEDHQLMPVLNIIGHFDQSQRSIKPQQHDSKPDSNEESPNVRHYHHQTYKDNNDNNQRQNHRTYCYKENQRCCRHSMEVTFKEIKGFEFIIQPKVFDAGYCQGRCPPRYNPAHHHALLQSLIWEQNHRKAPRPCCAPSKLVELEVLHVDEKDSNKLKISTWSDMKVAECACS